MPMSAGATSGTYVSVSPSHEKMAKRGTSSAVMGTIKDTSEAATSHAPARRGSRAIAKPAHEAKRSVSGTAIATTSAELNV
jgi:hypothetical protein